MEEPKTPVPQGSNNMMIIGIVILVAVVGGGIAYSQMGAGSKMDEQAPQDTMQKESADDEGAMMDEEMQVVEIEAGSFYYKPNVMTVKKGQKVKIVMNSVSMMHNFVIDELGVEMPITKDGETGTVEFTADQVGSFEYYCSVGNHRAEGQVGTITVTE